jgi:hypothetical protein
VTRVVATFTFLALVYPLAAFVTRGTVGFAGVLTVAAVTTTATLVFGVPAFLLFLRRDWLGWWQFAFGGVLIGLLCALPFAVGGAALVGALVPGFTGLGLLHGLFFWALAIWHNTGLTRRTRTPTGDASPPSTGPASPSRR